MLTQVYYFASYYWHDFSICLAIATFAHNCASMYLVAVALFHGIHCLVLSSAAYFRNHVATECISARSCKRHSQYKLVVQLSFVLVASVLKMLFDVFLEIHAFGSYLQHFDLLLWYSGSQIFTKLNISNNFGNFINIHYFKLHSFKFCRFYKLESLRRFGYIDYI
jgi:hypothetical protein